MPIFFALLVLGFAVHSIHGMHNSSNLKTDSRAIASDMLHDVNLQKELGYLAKRAFDAGRNSYCIGDNQEFFGIGGTGPNQVHLCWPRTMVSADFCLRTITYKGSRVCFALNQNSMASNLSSGPSIARLFQPNAALAEPVYKPYPRADFSGIPSQTGTAPTSSGGNNASAMVRLPQAEATSVQGNHISCSTPHTACFTIVFCLNGTRNCAGKNKFTSTFATRHF